MKTFVRIGSLVIALTLGGLLAGCASNAGTAKTTRYAREFEVVETSTKRTLTPKEMAQLQAMVAEYLQKEGATGTGDYYVKVYLTPDKDGVPGEWVVVRYSRSTEYVASHFSLMSSYPDYGYSSYYPRYNFDYYPFGWFGFSAFALSYYDDPFYYYGGVGGYYPRPPYGHTGDRRWDRDRDHHRNPDGHNDHDQPRVGYRPPGGLKPSFKPTEGVTATPRWSGPPSQDPRSRDGNYTNRSDPRQRWRDRDNNKNSGSPFAGTGTPYTPSYRPPSPQSVSENTGSSGRSYRSSGNRDGGSNESRRQYHDNGSSNNRPPPSVQDRTPSSSGNHPGFKPSYESQRRESSRDSQSSSYTPPAPVRSDPPPPPAYTPPSRSDSNDSYRPNSGDGSHDAGRRARSE